MRVLGIDPGSHRAGFGLVEGEGRRLRHLEHGVIQVKGSLSERLVGLFEGLAAVIARGQPDCVAVEGVFSHKNARSALVLGHARGIALLCAGQAGLEVIEYSTSKVKRSLAGSGRADKGQVQRMVQSLLGLDEPMGEDASDALALALCHLQHQGAAAAVKAAGPRGAGAWARARPSVVRNRPTVKAAPEAEAEAGGEGEPG